MVAVRQEIVKSLDAILVNTDLLRTYPDAVDSSYSSKSPESLSLARYTSLLLIKWRIPTDKKYGSGPLCVAGTGIAACTFLGTDSIRVVRLFWQKPDNTIVQATFSTTKGWENSLFEVTTNAMANTSIAATVSNDGKEVSSKVVPGHNTYGTTTANHEHFTIPRPGFFTWTATAV